MLRDAAYDSNFASVVSLACKRWRSLCTSDDFYRKVQLQPLTGRTIFLNRDSDKLEALLIQPRFRSVYDVAADGLALDTKVLSVIARAFSSLSCISFSGCTALSAQPLLDFLSTQSSIRSLDLSRTTCVPCSASPVAPKWIVAVMQATCALTCLDVQSCREFTTQSLRLVAHSCSSLTMLNISYTLASLEKLSDFRLVVRKTPGMRAFYCCGVSLPCGSRDDKGEMQWPHLQTLSINCQKPSVAEFHGQPSQVQHNDFFKCRFDFNWVACFLFHTVLRCSG